MPIPWTEPGPLLPLLLFAVAIATCLGLGLRLLARARLTTGDPAFLAAAALAAGMASLGLFTLAVGLLGGLAWLPWLLLLPVAAGVWPGARFCIRHLRGPSARMTMSQAALGAFLAATGLLGLLAALAPAANTDWDGLSYHLAAPAVYLRLGGIRFLPWDHHSNFPFLHEMLYLAALAVSGQGLAKLFHLLAGAVTCLALFGFVRARHGTHAGLLAAAIYASAPIVAWEAGVAYSDLALTMYLTLALGAWLAWREGQGEGWLLFAGIMLGAALGVKVTAVVALAVLALATLLSARQVGAGKRPHVRRLAMLALPALGLALPWYLKTYLWTGNPTYPFLYDTFGGRWWNAPLAAAYRAEQLGFGMGRGPLQLLLAPVNLTLNPARFGNFPDQPLLFNSLGPLFLALAPIGLIAGWRRPWARAAAWYAAGWLLAWFFLCQHLRYAIPALAPAAMLAALGAGVLLDRPGTLRVAAAALLTLALLGSLAVNLWASAAQAQVALGLIPKQQYLAAALPEYPLFDYANTNLPPGSRLALVGETRGFYLQRDYLWADHNTYLEVAEAPDADQLLARLRARRVTHLLVSRAALRSALGAPHSALAQALHQQRLRPLTQVVGNTLLAVREP